MYNVLFFSILLSLISSEVNASNTNSSDEVLVKSCNSGEIVRLYISKKEVSGIELREAYKKAHPRSALAGYDVEIVMSGKLLEPNQIYTKAFLRADCIPVALLRKKETNSPTTQEEEIAGLTWYEATSKSRYFLKKYKNLITSTKPDDSKWYNEIIKKNYALYDSLTDIVQQMNSKKQYMIIDEMLINAANKPYHTILNVLCRPEIIRAIAALQQIYGNGDPLLYNKEVSHVHDALISKIILDNDSEIEVTIYRFLYGIIQEIDDVNKTNPIEKDSALYNFLNKLDQALEFKC